MASEVGVIDLDPAKVVRKGRLQPGRMFLIDTAQGRIVGDEEVKRGLAQAQPYQQWLDDGPGGADDLPEREHIVFSHQSVLRRQQVFGYTHEELKIILAPMAKPGSSRSARWAPTRRSPCSASGRGCCSTTSSSCSRRSPTRRSTRSARRSSPRSGSTVGPEANLLGARPGELRQLVLPFPVIDNDELGQDHPHQRRPADGRVPGAGAPSSSAALPTSAAAAWR
jgi:glutamate synthase (NADPH/NADH) large chain